ncbi:hypothetical protein SeLEV6574_g02357 [Synchytrium endobioticum]|uniref:WKF domain-containing protein n=1 Tax=Synchytrium endobioticum TaxID=286115 RepID=A0A507D8N5_9FUNG|nr:hypothetical protein SeLEV6574_g02357 [Synchytrium endobioticum]
MAAALRRAHPTTTSTTSTATTTTRAPPAITTVSGAAIYTPPEPAKPAIFVTGLLGAAVVLALVVGTIWHFGKSKRRKTSASDLLNDISSIASNDRHHPSGAWKAFALRNGANPTVTSIPHFAIIGAECKSTRAALPSPPSPPSDAPAWRVSPVSPMDVADQWPCLHKCSEPQSANDAVSQRLSDNAIPPPRRRPPPTAADSNGIVRANDKKTDSGRIDIAPSPAALPVLEPKNPVPETRPSLPRLPQPQHSHSRLATNDVFIPGFGWANLPKAVFQQMIVESTVSNRQHLSSNVDRPDAPAQWMLPAAPMAKMQTTPAARIEAAGERRSRQKTSAAMGQRQSQPDISAPDTAPAPSPPREQASPAAATVEKTKKRPAAHPRRTRTRTRASTDKTPPDASPVASADPAPSAPQTTLRASKRKHRPDDPADLSQPPASDAPDAQRPPKKGKRSDPHATIVVPHPADPAPAQRKQKKRKTRAPPKEADDAKQLAAAYLHAWKHSPAQWKFNKSRQIWIIKHLFDPAMIPKAEFGLARRYLKGVQGNAQRITIAKARAAALSDDVVKVRRATKMLKTLNAETQVPGDAPHAPQDGPSDTA